MPIIKIFGLTCPENPNHLPQTREMLKQAVSRITELGLTEDQITVLFMPDLAPDEKHTEIIVEVTGLFSKPERDKGIQDKLARSIGFFLIGLCSKMWPDNQLVEVFIYPFHAEACGFFSKAKLPRVI